VRARAAAAHGHLQSDALEELLERAEADAELPPVYHDGRPAVAELTYIQVSNS